MTNQYTITILFGKEVIQKHLNGETLSALEKETHLKTYEFESEAEKFAFQRGVDEAVGWQESYILSEKLL